MKPTLRNLLPLLLLLGAGGAVAEDYYVIDKLLVGVRKEQKVDSPIIKTLPTATRLEVLRRDGDWALVRAPDGTEGWVDSQYISSDKPAVLVVRELEEQIEQLRKQAGRAAPANEEELQKLRSELDAAKEELAREKLEAARMKSELAKTKAALEAAGGNTDLVRHAHELEQQVGELQDRVHELEQALQQAREEAAEAKERAGKAREETERARLASPAGTPAPSIASLTGLVINRWVLGAVAAALLLGLVFGVWLMDWLNRRRHGGFRV
ncbi:MAG: TIGR04211 family SH3 domain-containing protein [Gammaproteobacteria bacterium]|nr:MAG: TIGR04211 family SH3 domain-containing protein [Gammaproteobacteria bacterium]